jgi:putative transposase
MPRGNDGRRIFVRNADREGFLVRLEKVTKRHGWLVYGYCLMDNHAHFVVQISDGGLSEGMQELLGGYARWWNREHGHVGHLFRNRFKDVPVKSQDQLLVTLRYIDLNPVAARMKFRPEQWPWSSYRAHIGLSHPPRFLANAEFLKLWGSTPDKARTAYARFVDQGRFSVSDTEG